MLVLVGSYKDSSSDCIPTTIFQYPLEEERSKELEKAYRNINKIYSMEVLYDHIIESMIEFKACMHDSNLRSVSVSHRLTAEWRRFQALESRRKLNRLVFNLLNFSKSYLDNHHKKSSDTSFVKSVTGSEEKHKRVLELYTEIGDSNYEYRLGCLLRNVGQHSQLPVDTLSYNVGFVNRSKKSCLSFYVPLNIRDILKNCPNLSKAQKEVFQHFGDEADLHAVLDGYVYAIGQFHMLNRYLVEDQITKYKHICDELINSVNKCYSGVNYIHVHDIQSSEKTEPLFTLEYDWLDVMEHLIKKNHNAVCWKDIGFSEYKL